MPTGTGGGHFSGGDSGGSSGGHFSSDGHSFGGRGRRGMRHGRSVYLYSFGNRQYYVSNKSHRGLMFLSYLCFFGIFVFLVANSFFFGAKNDLQKIKDDYSYYGLIIENAENQPSKIVVGNYIGCQYSDTAKKYCIKYTFSYNGTSHNGYSFYVYTKQECMAMGETIQIAVGNITAEGEPDSIEMTFKGKTLEDDGEYVYTLNSYNKTKVFLISSGVVTGGLFAGIILLSALSFKKDEESEEKSDVIEEKKVRRCSFCNSEIREGITSCPYCGAGENTFERKSPKE